MTEAASQPRGVRIRLVLCWGVVGIPLVYGLGQTLVRAAGLFTT